MEANKYTRVARDSTQPDKTKTETMIVCVAQQKKRMWSIFVQLVNKSRTCQVQEKGLGCSRLNTSCL